MERPLDPQALSTQTPGVTTILFDWGGTLIDFPGIYQSRHGECLRALYDELAASGLFSEVPWPSFRAVYEGAARSQLARYRESRRELHLEDRFAEVLQRLGLEGRADPASLVTQMSRHLVAASRPMEGAAKVLAALRSRFRLGLVSNYPYPPTVVATLRRFSLLEPLAACVVISGDLGWAKPDPRPFTQAMDALGAAPGECLFVGDDVENDVRGAAALGLSTAWLAPTGAPDVPEATFRLGGLGELPARLGVGGG